MSKSNWNNAELHKPPINEKDVFEKQQQRSERVAVWIEGYEYASFGTYNYQINHWSIEGSLGFDQSRVKWWQFITNPY